MASFFVKTYEDEKADEVKMQVFVVVFILSDTRGITAPIVLV